MLITPNVIRNREESRATTEEFKNKVLSIRNELESLRRDQERELEKMKRDWQEQQQACSNSGSSLQHRSANRTAKPVTE